MTTDNLTLSISEIFGPTFQGEGPSIGRRAAFIRLAGCNLHCSWCDTPFSWDWANYDPKVFITLMNPYQVANHAHQMDCNLIVITGGEPLLQREPLMALVSYLLDAGHQVEIETNGTQLGLDQDARIQYNISPKLAHAGDPLDVRIIPSVLAKWSTRMDARWKFVVKSELDKGEILGLVSSLNLVKNRVWIMPEGQTPEEMEVTQGMAAQVAEDLGCNFSDRLHIWLWGGKRGK